ncbi:galactose-binding domain-containing protein [Flavobacterium psychrotrophum]|uniref:galactose-binding domain-containing protein n=1 Tax=Flavobacterium psychrotrophum TaxID=2294119 RepID=UPI000E3223C7|nr:discoidin domain-containing protein [Flavobacterium psychrotrophum]
MKQRYLFALAIAFVFVCSGYAQIISNGGFENGVTSSWSNSFSSGQATFSSETTEFREGTKSLKVVVTQAGSTQEAIKSTNTTFTDTPKDTYLVRFWAKASADADLYVSVAGNETQKVHYKIRPHWKLYHLPFKTLSTALTLNFFYQNAATYYIDGVEILDQDSGVIDVEQTFKWNASYAAGWGWTAGDNDISLQLPDGRIAYFFNDSFYGTNDITDNEFHNSGAKFLRNAMVVEEADGLLHSRYSGSQSTTTRYFESIEASPSPGVDNFYWVGDAILDQNKILVYLVELLNESAGAVATNRTYVATLSYPGLVLEGITKQQSFTNGYESFFKDGNYIYLYKTINVGTWDRYTHVARCAKGDLLGTKGTWRFYNGSTWVTDVSQSQSVNPVGAESFIKLQKGNYAQISMPVLSRDVKVSFAQSPQGPWTTAQTIYTIPDDEQYWWYLPNIHHQLPNGKFQISYSVNSWEGWSDAWKDKFWYRQRYIQTDLLGLSPYTSNTGADNLALNKAVTVSGTYGTNQASYAVDGTTATRWESPYSDPQWLSVDLGASYEINQIKITWETAKASAYLIQVSHDGTNWQTIKSIKNNADEVNNHAALADIARYVRIYGTQRPTIWGYSIKELEVYGTPVSNVDITDLGGTITSQYNDSPAAEVVSKIIDNSSATKYLTFHASAYVTYEGITSYILNSYSITSGNDAPERDPLNWTLQGSNDSSAWTTIDTRTGEDFASRTQKRTFTFTNNKSFKYFRLNMTNNSGTTLQVAEIELFGYAAPIIATGSGMRMAAPGANESIARAGAKPYPVPFTNVVNIPLGNTIGEKLVALYDITGKLMFSDKTTKEDYFELNTSNISQPLSSGIYMVHVISDTVNIYRVIKN